MLKTIEDNLSKFQKPGRYIGSETGIPQKDFKNSPTRFVMSYPDLYEVGMSNNGLRIIYDIINKLDFASCERVFAPWSDFEEFLRINKIPLYSLESYTPLNEFDFLGFTIQYELLFTNMLNIMELGKIDCLRENRGDNTPIIIAGGPSAVNPSPFSPFVDIFFIGEAEASLEHFLEVYNELKNNKTKKDDIIRELSKIDGFYSPKYSKSVKRQIYSGFSLDCGIDTYISPIIDVVQNKTVVEITRGCPNKCRFCQAGVIYKPYREKNLDVIFNNIDKGVKSLGSTEVTLSSLSSGDYSQILELTDKFNYIYGERKVSFSLPSIKVESFNPELLEKISSVRKSGLTFAIEAGSIEGQKTLNKPIMLDKVKNIIEYASKNGWNLIKLYFMIGLPHVENEKEAIIDFIENVLKINKKLNINVNVAVFVPKPHTPYQNERQLNLEESVEILDEIRERFKKTRARIKSHNPYTSYVEGFISRGDERVGLAVYEVFKNGGRLDGWSEKFNFELYKDAFEKYNITYDKYLSKKSLDDKNVWDMVDVGLTREYLSKENKKSQNKEFTPSCKEGCEKECSICGGDVKKVNSDKQSNANLEKYKNSSEKREKKTTRYFLEFSKSGLLKFIGHIDTLKYFERLFLVSEISSAFTEGFNPHPKLQFCSPLPLGIESQCEILEFFTNFDYDEKDLLDKLKFNENPNLRINRLKKINYQKKISLANEVYSSVYTIYFPVSQIEKVKARTDIFKNGNLQFEFEKNGKKISGIYSKYIDFLSLMDNNITIEVRNVPEVPKLQETLSDIFGEIDLKIVKKVIYGFKDGKKEPLFSMIG